MGFKLLKYEIKCGVRFYDVQRYEPKIATQLKLIQLFLFGVFLMKKFGFVCTYGKPKIRAIVFIFC